MKQDFRIRFATFGIFVIFVMLAIMPTSVSVNAQGAGTPSPLPVSTSSLTSSPSPIPTATLTVEERLTHLEKVVALPQKDGWDKTKIIADILIAIAAGIVLTGFSVWATSSFNKQQLKSDEIRAKAQLESEELRSKNQIASEEQRAKEQKQIQEIQTVQSFMPQLQSNDPRAIEAALLAITSLGNEQLAARLAELFHNEGAIAALNKMFVSGNQSVAEAAERSLNQIYKQTIRGIVQVSTGGVISGAGFFIRQDGYVITTQNAVSGQEDISVVTPFATLPAKVVKINEKDNLALLKVPGNDFTALSVSSKEMELEMMEEVILIGHDTRVGITVTLGKYVGTKRSPEYSRTDLISINVLAPRSFGGAVALDKRGQLLGMVVLLWVDELKQATTAYVLPALSLADFILESTSIMK